MLAIFLLARSIAIGQEYPKLHFTVEDGLPSSTVYYCYRDSKGFMWLTTDKGVVRYNGVRFDVYNTFNGLPDNEIFFVQEDLQGRIWLATYNGELCYFKDDKFYTAANKAFLKQRVKGQFIQKITVEADSSVTLLNYNKQFVNIKNESAGSFRLDGYTTPQTRTHMAIRKVADSVYRIVGSSSDDIVKFDSRGYKVISTIRNKYHQDSGQQNTRWSAIDGQNKHYIVNDHYVFDRGWNVLHNLIPDFHKRYFLYEIYRDGANWLFATNKGVLVNDSLRLLAGEKVSCITQDKEGNYWFSTLNNGVFVISKNYLNSGIYERAYTGSIKYASVLNGQLTFIDDKSNVFTLSRHKGVDKVFDYHTFFNPEPQFSFPAYHIDARGKLYYISNKNAFTVDDITSRNSAVHRYKSNVQPFFAFKQLSLAGDGIFLNAGFKVVSTTLIGEGAALNYHVVGDSLSPDKIFGYAQDGKGNIWYSTINGLFMVEKGVPAVQKRFSNLALKAFTFLGDHLVGYTHDNVLLFTSGNGADMKIDTIPPQMCVWNTLYPVDDRHLFITTDNWYRILEVRNEGGKAVPIVTPVDNPFIPLHAEAAAFDAKSGYFFKSGSITSIATEDIFHKASAPRLFFTTVTGGGRQYGAGQPLELPFNNSRNLIISFATVSFGGKKLTYQYSFSKKGKDIWIDLKEEQINMVNPGYGEYKVKVRAKTLSSGYSRPEILALTILRPFWLTWWFVAIVVFVILVLLWLIIRRRIIIEVKRREIEHYNQVKFMKSEYKALNALMNPHFIFNTLNNVQSLVNKDDKRAANEYLRIFADLVRQNMHNVSNELIPMEKEMRLVSNYLLLEKLRFKDKLHYTINIDEGIDLSEIMVPPLLIQPLVENSIKHGIYPLDSPEGTVIIEVFEGNNTLSVEVRDNGVGLTNNGNTGEIEGHISFGLANIRKRVEQLSIIQNRRITFEITEEIVGDQKWTVSKVSMGLNNGMD